VPLGPRYHHREFPASLLLDRKASTTITVCFPARDEAATIGPIVECVRRHLVEAVALVDEILVIDDHSSDGTAKLAADAGARVVAADSVLGEFGEGHGKGEALWKSIYASQGDLLVWCDADIVDFDDRFVRGLVGPLLIDEAVQFVKGHYRRPEAGTVGGGRVTELVARPVLSLLFPEMTEVVQPLSGEFAIRRRAAEQVPFVEGYGVDLALVLDVAARFGPEVVAQVDLDDRVDRNRSLVELSPQALAVLVAALGRVGVPVPEACDLRRPDGSKVQVGLGERPPMDSVPAYHRARESVAEISGSVSNRRQVR
jgi:glucosyl-3-phosphoglycerate synthase